MLLFRILRLLFPYALSWFFLFGMIERERIYVHIGHYIVSVSIGETLPVVAYAAGKHIAHFDHYARSRVSELKSIIRRRLNYAVSFPQLSGTANDSEEQQQRQ